MIIASRVVELIEKAGEVVLDVISTSDVSHPVREIT